jgi:hypothetical protein
MPKQLRGAFYSLAVLWGAIMATPTQAADAPPTLSYLHLYSDSQGESHFKQAELSFSAVQREGRSGGPMAHRLAGTEGAMFLRLKSGAAEDWHAAPRTWFLIVLQGISEVTASDGEKRQLKPGMMMLMDDTTGKGHQTRTVGPEDHVAVVIPFKE